jgi:small basic protein
MSFTLPSKIQIDEFFGKLRALLWGIFEVVLFVLAMVAVIMFALSHVPTS